MNIEYRIVMHEDMYYFMRAHVRSAMFEDCQKWLKRARVLRMKIGNFVRAPKPVYHGGAE